MNIVSDPTSFIPLPPRSLGRVKAEGTTLIELSISVAIVAIFSVMAVPAFKGLLSANRVTTYANEFLGSLHLARNEAAMRRQHVVMCKSSNGKTCAPYGNWAQGWIIFVDTSDNQQVTSGQTPPETILRVHDPLNSDITLTGKNNAKNYVSYKTDGRTTNNDTLSVCSRSSGAKSAVILSLVGRARTDKTKAVCP